MLKVSYTREGQKFSIRLEGHAGYAEVGKDIVCSSASILAYTVASYVIEAEKRGDLLSEAEIRLESGDTVIECKPTEDAYEGVRHMYLFATLGYSLLAETYPRYVELITDAEALKP
jgi:uncharacterized protein YsxB (DUF464 family)